MPEITGPKVYFRLFDKIPITETVVNMWIIMAVIFVLCIVLTWKMKKFPGKRQAIAEKIVLSIDKLVESTMGKDKMGFAPYILSLFIFSIFCTLSSLFALRSPTGDLNVTMGWALITFCLVQVNSIRRKGVKGYLKHFVEPMPLLLPLNIISEFSTPISMGFRHFGNVAAGTVISTLLYGALAGLTTMLLHIDFPLLQIGIPGFLSLYFDLFTAVLQAFIFCMLTMVFTAMAMD